MRTRLRNILIAFAFVASLSAVIVGLHAQNVAINSPTPPAATTVARFERGAVPGGG